MALDVCKRGRCFVEKKKKLIKVKYKVNDLGCGARIVHMPMRLVAWKSIFSESRVL